MKKTVSDLIAYTTLFSALLMLLGYLCGLEFFYRPSFESPATNPLTIICFLCISALLLSHQNRFLSAATPFTLLIVLAISITQISNLLLVDGSVTNITSIVFTEEVKQQLAEGRSNTMSLNTAIMFMLITLGYIAWRTQYFKTALIATSVASIVPLSVLIGYVANIETLILEMSLYTAVLGSIQSVVILSMDINNYLFQSGHNE